MLSPLKISLANDSGNCHYSQVATSMMTRKRVHVVDNTTMPYLKIYTKEELLAMFDKARGDVSRREFAKRAGIKYQHVQDWYRPGRKNNKINYEDSIRIINAAFGSRENTAPLTLNDIMQEVLELKEVVADLQTEGFLHRQKNKPSGSKANA